MPGVVGRIVRALAQGPVCVPDRGRPVCGWFVYRSFSRIVGMHARIGCVVCVCGAGNRQTDKRTKPIDWSVCVYMCAGILHPRTPVIRMVYVRHTIPSPMAHSVRALLEL